MTNLFSMKMAVRIMLHREVYLKIIVLLYATYE